MCTRRKRYAAWVRAGLGIRINLAHVPHDMRIHQIDRSLHQRHEGAGWLPGIDLTAERSQCGLPVRGASFTRLLAARSGRVSTGVLVGASVVLVGGILAFSWRGVPQAQNVSTVPPVPDITQLPAVTGGSALNNVGVGEGLFISIADKRDPTRVAGQLLAARSTPLEGRRYEMEEPRVWIYLRDGRTVYFEAQSGRALLPDLAGARPEDGLIKGKVRGRMFAPTAGGERPDPATATPILTLQTEELTFDLRVGEVRFPSNVTLKGDRVDFAGSGCLLVLTEGDQQLEQLRVERTDTLTIYPAKRGEENVSAKDKSPAVASAVAAGPGAGAHISHPAGGGAAPSAAANVADETMYAVTIDENVTIRRGGVWLMAHRVESFIRLVDNALPQRDVVASGEHNISNKRASGTRAGYAIVPAVYTQPAVTKPAPKPKVTAKSQRKSTPDALDLAKGEEPISLMFSGPMEARMLRAMPDQLRASDAWVRAVGSEKTYVTLGDDSQGLVGTAAAVWYSTTQRLAGLMGTAAKPAIVSKIGSGAAAGESFEINQRTGLVLAVGRGWL